MTREEARAFAEEGKTIGAGEHIINLLERYADGKMAYDVFCRSVIILSPEAIREVYDEINKAENVYNTVINGKYIDTRYTLDHGWETMVFECDANGKVTDWGELDVAWYRDRATAEAGHFMMVTKWAIERSEK